MKTHLLLKSYLGFSLFYLVIIVLGQENLAWYLKPFLLPFLIISVAAYPIFPTKKILSVALTFSWIGDLILMFADKGDLYFILGLVAFLISHIFYIVLFLNQKTEVNGGKTTLFWLSVLVVLFYLKSILSLLFPKLGDLKIPVALYATVISILLIVALRCYFSSKNASRYLILSGAVFFVISDSVLAINKFYNLIPNASFWIMSTYLIAQFCLTWAILKWNHKNNYIKE